jgi:hypothetical protein
MIRAPQVVKGSLPLEGSHAPSEKINTDAIPFFGDIGLGFAVDHHDIRA